MKGTQDSRGVLRFSGTLILGCGTGQNYAYRYYKV